MVIGEMGVKGLDEEAAIIKAKIPCISWSAIWYESTLASKSDLAQASY